MTFSIGNPEGLQQPHFGKYFFGKTLKRTRVNVTITFFSCLQHLFINFHQLLLYSSTLVAILIKKKTPSYTTFCAPCHEVYGHDVYLAMNRKSGYDFSVSNEAIFKQYVINCTFS